MHLHAVEESIVKKVILSKSAVDAFDVVGSHDKAMDAVPLQYIIFCSIT